ncbi:TRF2-interacting telomeric protein/Rap1 C terminal domain-containing protein [Nemania sp. FL0031]|nr:TRF2-interacting telomeric protein/Rap1 C terminal domain-containing protein [Nemania sp. FL0031]
MSAPGITYSGVLAKKYANDSVDAGTDAGVFGGLKFWVSARVPNRKSCVNNIQENGGTIVLKEGNADILICDPTKAPVPSSYSYELIADAIKEGSLDAKEDYLCSSLATDADLPSRLSSKPKLTRSKFTQKDDQILTKFVTEKERLGEPISGNDIYKKFAERHPHHTWQSWRDRWVKRLKNISRPLVSDRGQSPQPKGTPAVSHQEVPTSKSPVTKTRARFTAEEDGILLETIHNAIENHEPWNGHQPYKRLASEFPQRTYASWRERAVNHVAKQNKDLITQWELEINFRPSDEEDAAMNDVEDQETRATEDKGIPSSPSIKRGGKDARTGVINGAIEEDIAHPNISEGDNNQGSEDTILPPIQRNASVEPSPTPRPRAKGNVFNYSSPSTPKATDHEAPITTEQQFYRDYNTFLESVGIIDKRIPSVGGRAIALWDLWQSVRSKKVEAAELDWQQIAEDLGFDWVSMESIPDDIRQCYEEHLGPFADAMMNFNDSSDEEDSADAETEELLPSSPPVRASLKQPPATTNKAYDHHFLQSSPKRRRIDRGYEISSTPEHVNGTPHSRPPGDSIKTPTTSPLANHKVAKRISRTRAQFNNDNRTGDKVGNGDASPSIHSRGRKRQFEPETQEFAFGPDTQAYTHDEEPGHSNSASQRDMTPSQQLLLESDAISPTIQQEATTPTPRRIRGAPLQDSTQAHSKSPRNARTPPTQKTQRQRRTLPSSWASKSPMASSSTAPQQIQSSYTTVPETEPRRRPTPPKETPDDIIDHFVSLGYARDSVLRSLRATSWIIGNAGQVMEMLKQGEPLPVRTSGVWTDRDDEALALVYSKEPPADAKAEKKVAREMRRLQAKHGDEQIALRKKYLLDELSE